jgi:hypothetical protein
LRSRFLTLLPVPNYPRLSYGTLVNQSIPLFRVLAADQTMTSVKSKECKPIILETLPPRSKSRAWDELRQVATVKSAMLGRIARMNVRTSGVIVFQTPLCVVEIITRSLVPDSQAGRFEHCVAPETMRRVDHRTASQAMFHALIYPIPRHQSI